MDPESIVIYSTNMQCFWMKEVELSWHLMDKEAGEVRAECQTSPRLHGPFLPPNHETTLGNVELFVIQLQFPLLSDKGVLYLWRKDFNPLHTLKPAF